jgi:hypothetical protein
MCYLSWVLVRDTLSGCIVDLKLHFKPALKFCVTHFKEFLVQLAWVRI